MRLHLLLLSNMKRLSLLFIGILASYNATHAQIHRTEATDSANVSQTYNLNPIVVTGSGHHQRLKSTATPVHVLSAQDISEQGITTFDDALTRMMPQTSMAPNSMGSFLRLPDKRSETLWRHLQQYRLEPSEYGSREAYRGVGRGSLVALWL